MSTLQNAIDSLDDNGLWGLVACALAVGQADGRVDTSEKNELAQCLRSLGCDRAAGMEVINAVLEQVDGMGANEIVDWAVQYIGSEDIGEAAVVLAAAVATKTGGLGAKEGVVIQYIANAVGVGYPGNRYMQLLGEGMQLGKG